MHTNPEFQSVANQFRALGNERRIHIVHLLRLRRRTVNELANILAIRDPNVTKHLQRLHNCGLVEGKRKGATVEFFLCKAVKTSGTFWKVLKEGLR